MEPTSACDPSLAVLSLMAEYHDRAGEGFPQRRGRPARERLIEERLLARAEAHGAYQVPARLELFRPARVVSDRGEVAGATLSVSLDSVEVALARQGQRPAVKRQSSVVLAIQTGTPKVWWRFLGKVTCVRAHGRTLKVRLVRSLFSTACTSFTEPGLEVGPGSEATP